ncbi:hypothetical protein DPMN_133384 [Dreissena polymorpha]|uniref:Uncharacterized protein n=1 Tax=Dreissena polymorpha TaxID=45954 RepID=A0A9D4JER5_DREPO|nr:hypothetical protein DPMN_133384 [Dreissena polymorpha]
MGQIPYAASIPQHRPVRPGTTLYAESHKTLNDFTGYSVAPLQDWADWFEASQTTYGIRPFFHMMLFIHI